MLPNVDHRVVDHRVVNHHVRPPPDGDDLTFPLHRASAALQRRGQHVIDATLGVLLGDDGRLIVLPSLRRALAELPPEAWAPYAPIAGEPPYLEAVRRQVFGDCAMMMHGAEMLTALVARLPVKVFVLNDQGHGMVEHGLALPGTPVTGLRLPRRVDFVALGQAFGVPAFHVESLRELAQVDWAHHLNAPEPLIVDVAIDPAAVPPILARTRVLGVGHAQSGDES